MLRTRVDWDDERTPVDLAIDWRPTRVVGGRSDPEGVARRVSVLAPTESVLLEATTLEWDDRRARLLRCAGRALVESPIVVHGRTRVSAFADASAVEFIPSAECRVPTALAVAGISGCVPRRRTIRLEWDDGVHRLCAWSRSGRWVPTPLRTADVEVWCVGPDGEVTSSRSPLALPRLDPRVWLAIGAARVAGRAGTFPARDPGCWRQRAFDLAAATVLGSSIALYAGFERRLDESSRELEEAQRSFESQRHRFERQRFELGRHDPKTFDPNGSEGER